MFKNASLMGKLVLINPTLIMFIPTPKNYYMAAISIQYIITTHNKVVCVCVDREKKTH